MKFRENVSLAQFSSYRIGGVARFFFEPKSEREIAWAVREARERMLPVFILGGGTNLLLSDDGFDGLVIHPALAGITAGKVFDVGSGASMADLLKYTASRGLSGLEWAGGLPGTLGGAIRGNAGCFGGEMKDVVASVRSFDMKTMKVVRRTAKDCGFGYRDSIFKHAGKTGAQSVGAARTSTAIASRATTSGAGEIILSATLALAKGDKKIIARTIKEKIEYRTKNHPLEHPNIGSIFKNVPLSDIHDATSRKYEAALVKQSLAFRGSQFSVKTDPFPVISAAKLIAESGLRGVSFGGAMIAAKHPNFIVNVLNASASDVKKLIVLAKSEVKKKFGVALAEEVQVI